MSNKHLRALQDFLTLHNVCNIRHGTCNRVDRWNARRDHNFLNHDLACHEFICVMYYEHCEHYDVGEISVGRALGETNEILVFVMLITTWQARGRFSIRDMSTDRLFLVLLIKYTLMLQLV